MPEIDPVSANALISVVREVRATLVALEARLGCHDLDPGERTVLGRQLVAVRKDDAAARDNLEAVTGIRLTAFGNWQEPHQPDAVRARIAFLERHLPPGTKIDKRTLPGGRVALLYRADAPAPLVTPVDRARGRAAAEVRG